MSHSLHTSTHHAVCRRCSARSCSAGWRRTSRCFEMRRSCCVSTRRWHAASVTARTSTCTDADVRAAIGRLMAAHHNTAHVCTQMIRQAIRAGSLYCMFSQVFQTEIQHESLSFSRAAVTMATSHQSERSIDVSLQERFSARLADNCPSNSCHAPP